MEGVRQKSTLDYIFSMIKEEAKRFESKNGEVEFLVSSDTIERAKAEAELFIELEKGKWSAENEPTLTLEEFENLLTKVKLKLNFYSLLFK